MLNPEPVRSIPILIGGGGEKKTLQYIAKGGDVWHFWWGDEWAHKNDVLINWCEKLGRDHTQIKRSVGVDADKIEDFDALFAGLAEAPIDEITVGTGGPDYDLDKFTKFLEFRDSLR